MKTVVLSFLVVGAVALSLSLGSRLQGTPESTPMGQFLLTDPLENPSFEDWFCRQVEAGELAPQEGLSCP